MNTENAPETTHPTSADAHDRERRSQKRPPVRERGRAQPRNNAKPAARRSGSKQDRVIALLSRNPGATVASIMRATGWQKHSVHGFLAGVVKKKLGLTLVSEKTDGDRVYRIESRKPGRRAASKTSSRRRAG